MRISLAATTAALLVVCDMANGAVASAEFAIRWEAGGPMTADEVLDQLKIGGKRKRTRYEIQYFDLSPAAPLASGETAMGRLRKRADGKLELTYKSRTPKLDLASPWRCPLPGAKEKAEIDVTISADGEHRVLSRSCELEAKDGETPAFPQALSAKARLSRRRCCTARRCSRMRP